MVMSSRLPITCRQAYSRHMFAGSRRNIVLLSLLMTLGAACATVDVGVTATRARQIDDAPLIPDDTSPDAPPSTPGPDLVEGVIDFGTEKPVDQESEERDAFLTAAVTDVELFMTEFFPEVYGQPFEPLEGGIFAAYPERPDDEPIPGCGTPQTLYADVEGNAFYCFLGDFIAYDQPGPNAIPRSVRAVSQTVTAGSPVTVPILMTTTGVETRVAFSVEFAPGVLGIPSVACGSATLGCTVAFDNTQPGRYGITITPVGAIAAGSREIARVTFPTSATTLTSTPVRFGEIPTARNVRNAEGNPLPVLYWTDGTISFTGGTVLTGATITGRVTTPSGQGLRNAQVVLLDTVGNRSIATTGSFGNYTFEGLELGRDYMVTVVSRRYRFAPRTVNLTGNLTGFDLVGLE